MNVNLKLFLSLAFLLLLLTACSATDQLKEQTTKGESSTNEDNHQTNDSLGGIPEDDKQNNLPEEAENSVPKAPVDNILTNLADRSIVTLVNKEFSLTIDDAPTDLVTVDVPTILENPEVNQLRKVAADALKLMFDKAIEDDIYLHARSGYRSYQTQEQLFQANVDKNGLESANRYSAKPGQSEHQTGLTMDVTSESVNFQLTETFGETAEGRWISEHAHEFGFIIRYPQGKEAITGYIYEPWHLRYLGIDMATLVFDSKLTYEEFLDKEGITNDVTP